MLLVRRGGQNLLDDRNAGVLPFERLNQLRKDFRSGHLEVREHELRSPLLIGDALFSRASDGDGERNNDQRSHETPTHSHPALRPETL